MRMLDGRRGPLEFIGFGLATGVGWWSSPEVVYFLLPAGILVIAAIVVDRGAHRAMRWAISIAIGLGAAIVGSLPWLWSNINSSWASVNTFGLPPGAPHFVGRLRQFFEFSVGILLSLRNTGTGAWAFAKPLGILVEALVGVIVVAAVALCVLRRDRAIALAAGVVAFPLLLSYFPGSYYWQDGRYIPFVIPLASLMIIAAAPEAARRFGAWRHRDPVGENNAALAMVGSIGVVVMALTVINFAVFAVPLSSFFNAWGDPNSPTTAAIAKLEAAGVNAGYADYWAAYRLDYLSGAKLNITALPGPDRSETIRHRVLAAKSPAWIFVPSAQAQLTQFDAYSTVGPDQVTEAEFIADLKRLGIGYRVVAAGPVVAVIPNRNVAPHQVGVPDTT